MAGAVADGHAGDSAQRSWRRSARVVVAAVAAMIATMLFAASPPTTQAASASFCGYAIPSSYNWMCSSGSYTWTYASARYPGSGVIDVLRAGLRQQTVEWYGQTNGGTFASVCHYPHYTRYGAAAQYEASGAAHTINGNVDDSGAHTGCV